MIVRDKKAVSELITTVFLILLVIGVVAIVGAIVIPFVRDSMSGVGSATACIETQLSLDGLKCTPISNSGTLNGVIRRSGTGSASVDSVTLFIEDSDEVDVNGPKEVAIEGSDLTASGTSKKFGFTRVYNTDCNAVDGGARVRMVYTLDGQACEPVYAELP